MLNDGKLVMHPEAFKNIDFLFLREFPRITQFEKGSPYTFFRKSSEEIWDPIEDGSALVMSLQGKGLVAISGCAHAGIINTIHYAIKVTDTQKVHSVIGSFI